MVLERLKVCPKDLVPVDDRVEGLLQGLNVQLTF
jgi:hypothetical protein